MAEPAEVQPSETETTQKILKQVVSKIENLEEEKKGIADDISEAYKEAKSFGLEPRIIRKIISLRKVDLNKREEDAELLELYMSAIGMEV